MRFSRSFLIGCGWFLIFLVICFGIIFGFFTVGLIFSFPGSFFVFILFYLILTSRVFLMLGVITAILPFCYFRLLPIALSLSLVGYYGEYASGFRYPAFIVSYIKIPFSY